MSRFLLKVIFGDYQTSQCFQNISSWMIRLQCILWQKILWPRHINLKWLFGVSQCFEKTPSCYSADRGESETKLSSPVYKIPPLQIDKYILQFGQIRKKYVKIHLLLFTNTFCSLGKYIRNRLKFICYYSQIHFAVWTNTFWYSADEGERESGTKMSSPVSIRSAGPTPH